MGLAIHTTLNLRRDASDEEVRRMVESVHARAEKLVADRGLKKIFPVDLASELPFVFRWLSIEVDEWTHSALDIPLLAGWGFLVLPGEDCEPAVFGLCRHPATVTDGAGRVHHTGLGSGWSFQSACKTQFASTHGWDHFLKCHRSVIDLAVLWRDAGVDVDLRDEGDYWPGHNEEALRRKLGTHNGLVAGMAGALRDAADEGSGPSVESPIFQHPEFERLEAGGASEHGEKIEQARRAIDENLPLPPNA